MRVSTSGSSRFRRFARASQSRGAGRSRSRRRARQSTNNRIVSRCEASTQATEATKMIQMGSTRAVNSEFPLA